MTSCANSGKIPENLLIYLRLALIEKSSKPAKLHKKTKKFQSNKKMAGGFLGVANGVNEVLTIGSGSAG